ncbi:MAG: hypothetical protein O2912_11105, partial [Proteobacteria bacterium]|nr:hypothetical protein [Pseudomonadota bacterium]
LTSREHPKDGEVWIVGAPLPDPAFNAALTRPPLLGENTADVLGDWLGWTEDKINAIVLPATAKDEA